ncbi:MAG: NERD domain-containing protein [Candidatus Hydrogenedentes bacterium]|nr:NERD domain-containing protein [Candidatus Hydrogenedentota bacterium]
MRLIPSQPLDNRSRAELRVFDSLRAAFAGPSQSDWFAMHSLNVPQHEYKRFGEIDFVVCGPDGLFVLEVKGGGVSCHDGVWETRNRAGQTDHLKESPFRQAESALHGLLKKRLPTSAIAELVVGYGVVMPDVQGLPESAEWDRATLADARDCRQFERWLEKLIAHWRAKVHRKPTATPDQLRLLQQYLRPDFEAVKSLHRSAHEIEERIARLTEDQLDLLDIVEENERVICSGGAGTGKTMLAQELAKRWSAAGKQVALACHSPWLKTCLEKSAAPGVTVTLADSIHVTARRAGIEKFDALIVDEGQDLLNLDSLSRLDDALRGGIEKGRWCFFHDRNNQSGLCGEYSPEAYEYLSSVAPARVPLKTNCRNTLPVLQCIQDALKADLGTAAVGDGPAVREFIVSSEGDAVHALQSELNTLVNKDGFDPSEIVVLSPRTLHQSCAASLAGAKHPRITELDSYSPRGPGGGAIGFAQVDNFKGLESPVVVLVDLPSPCMDSPSRALHYVGMSRARALLSMICLGSARNLNGPSSE